MGIMIYALMVVGAGLAFGVYRYLQMGAGKEGGNKI